ncbi:glutathione S-transferase family protein [Dasania marina]|uniref:glutathione S-transferase family protein n=1 Tax=Dasania marina TaxID=471499 RepID=UPI0030DBD2A2|tara:strand:- start:55196 stop:55858 length:663 start_codon:yes stop_codon:yes gene_type:complete
MYTLYTCSKDYTEEPTSLAPQIALEEIGADYNLVEVDLFDVPEWFYKLHPRGKIPVLAVSPSDPAGEPLLIYPSTAILLYLAEQHPSCKLLPAAGTNQRALAYKWMIYLSEELQAWFMMDSFPERYCLEESQKTIIESKAALLIDEAWQEIDKELATHPYLLGQNYSVIDLFLYMTTRWIRPEIHKRLNHYPNIARTVSLIESREAVLRTLKNNDMAVIS